MFETDSYEHADLGSVSVEDLRLQPKAMGYDSSTSSRSVHRGLAVWAAVLVISDSVLITILVVSVLVDPDRRSSKKGMKLWL